MSNLDSNERNLHFSYQNIHFQLRQKKKKKKKKKKKMDVLKLFKSKNQKND